MDADAWAANWARVNAELAEAEEQTNTYDLFGSSLPPGSPAATLIFGSSPPPTPPDPNTYDLFGSSLPPTPPDPDGALAAAAPAAEPAAFAAGMLQGYKLGRVAQQQQPQQQPPAAEPAAFDRRPAADNAMNMKGAKAMKAMKAMQAQGAAKKAISPGELYSAIASKTGLKPQTVKRVFLELRIVCSRELHFKGKFDIPQLVKMTTKPKAERPARKMMVFGKEKQIPAKKASNAVVVRPDSTLKNAI